MNFTVGTKVKVDKCNSCPAIVGKVAVISSVGEDGGEHVVQLNFGRGRPQANRPKFVSVLDISLVNECDNNDKP